MATILSPCLAAGFPIIASINVDRGAFDHHLPAGLQSHLVIGLHLHILPNQAQFTLSTIDLDVGRGGDGDNVIGTVDDNAVFAILIPNLNLFLAVGVIQADGMAAA